MQLNLRTVIVGGGSEIYSNDVSRISFGKNSPLGLKSFMSIGHLGNEFRDCEVEQMEDLEVSRRVEVVKLQHISLA